MARPRVIASSRTTARFTTSGTLGGNATYSLALNAASSYPYYCGIHPNMVGTITVNP